MLLTDSADFEQFYTVKIAPVLPKLRAECKRVDDWGYKGLLAALMGFGAFIGYHAGVIPGALAAWLFALCAAGVVYSVYKYAQQNDSFTADYKSAIIKEIIDYVCPGLIYRPDELVTAKEYKYSSLFRHRFDYFDGNDYIAGVINQVSFHCSELHVQCDYSGNRQMTIFKGLFMVAGINKRFTGGTYVWPRGGTHFANSLMDQYVRLMPMPAVTGLHFNDPEFDRYFRVCTTWPEQAREILSPEMRSKMVRLRMELDIIVSFSFVAEQCYIALPLSKDLLEPSAYDPGDKEEIRKYFITVQLIPEIISHLPLVGLQ